MRKFLEESIFEESSVAKERAAAEGNARAEDVVVVYRNKGSEGIEGERKLQYFVVDGIEALNKFGADPWCVPFFFGLLLNFWWSYNVTLLCLYVQGTSGLCDDHWPGVAIPPLQVERAEAVVP